MIKLTRRGLIAGTASLLAAPAIVRASSLMPVKMFPEPILRWDPAIAYMDDGDQWVVNYAWRAMGEREWHHESRSLSAQEVSGSWPGDEVTFAVDLPDTAEEFEIGEVTVEIADYWEQAKRGRLV
jgi:hypothetical protein